MPYDSNNVFVWPQAMLDSDPVTYGNFMKLADRIDDLRTRLDSHLETHLGRADDDDSQTPSAE